MKDELVLSCPTSVCRIERGAGIIKIFGRTRVGAINIANEKHNDLDMQNGIVWCIVHKRIENNGACGRSGRWCRGGGVLLKLVVLMMGG